MTEPTDRDDRGRFTVDGARAHVSALNARLSDVERSDRARAAARARWGNREPKRHTQAALDPETLAVWVDEVRDRFPAEAATMTDAELKKRAMLLLKAERAKARAGRYDADGEPEA